MTDAQSPDSQAAATPDDFRFSPIADGNVDYSAKDMEYLTDQEHVRERPSMYISDTQTNGLHHLVNEIVDNSIDEAMAGFASEITVTVNNDDSITVEDNGRGIPVEDHSDIGKSTLEGVMTLLKFGGKFSKGAYQTSGGLHGVGATVVNFLSEWCEVEVCRDGYRYHQGYVRGIPEGTVKKMGQSTHRGTKTTFKPDAEIFSETKFDFSRLCRRLQDLAFLNSNIKITVRDARNSQEEVYLYANGLVDFVTNLNRATEPLHKDVIHIKTMMDSVQVEVAFQYTEEYTENIRSYANNVYTINGGTHLSGFKTALTRTLNAYGKKEDMFKSLVPTGDDFREGLTAIIAVRVPEPQFEAQTKIKLWNAEVEGIVNSAVGEALAKFLEESPRVAQTILKKGLLAAEARESARKARLLVRERKGVLSHGGLPGKLRDCSSRDVDKCELYLVEGDSAGGSAEGGRVREFQAILPLRGKIINAYKARDEKVLLNEEIRSMITAIGAGIGDEMDLTKRRYGKIVIMTDADVDGSHIRTLLLTFFYRMMQPLVRSGHVYIACPPLYRMRRKGQNDRYIQTEGEMRQITLDLGIADARFDAGDGHIVEGEAMIQLCKTLSSLEESIISLERRGISLRDHAARRNAASGHLPIYHTIFQTVERWFASRQELDDYLAEIEVQTGGAEVDSGETDEAASRRRVHVVELHEVRTLNRLLDDLAKLGFGIDALLPQDRTGKDTARYHLVRGESRSGLGDLRELMEAIADWVRSQKNIQITRFKGLGEMDPEELRETTLNLTNRSLIQVTMDDASAADELFRILMGDKVEPRREFIEKHSLEVRHLDV
ncbi:MAG: DNA gyrase subunit B [Thermoguttaceae bacterium]